jgi:hypothetical protein
MLTRHRFLAIAFCAVTSSMLVAGCGTPIPEVIQASSTVVATPTPAGESATLVSTPEVSLTPTTGSPTSPPPLSSTSTVPPTILPAPPSEERYQDRGAPVSLLASYFNAINRKEYRRAWEYWENPPNRSYEDFMRGYAETESVFLVVHPPTFLEGAAGSTYASIPALLIATHVDGSQQAYVGCYVTRRHNLGVDGAPADGEWSLYRAAVAATPGNTTDAILLVRACEM